MAGGAGVSHVEEPVRHAADFSQTRRDHSRPRLLQLPRPRVEKGTGGPHRKYGQAGRRQRRRAKRVLARDSRRSRLADRDRGRTRRQAPSPAVAAAPRRKPRLTGRRRRPAAHCATARRRLTPPIDPENVVPRRLLSADWRSVSITSRFAVLKISQDDEGQNENLRLVSNPPRGSNLRPPQIRRLDRKKTPPQHPRNPHLKPGSDPARPARIAGSLGVTPLRQTRPKFSRRSPTGLRYHPSQLRTGPSTTLADLFERSAHLPSTMRASKRRSAREGGGDSLSNRWGGP